MKTKLKLHFFLLLVLLSVPALARAQGTAFSYQGHMLENGAAANGGHDFIFTLFDSAAGVGQIGPAVPLNNAPVANGQFNVTLDFGANAFPGGARWLEISVRPAGVGQFTKMDARVSLLPTPYAIFAGSAGNVASGAVTANQLNTGGIAPTSGQFLSYNGGNLFWSDPGVVVGNIWSALNGNAYYNAGNVGIGTTTPSLYGHGGTGRILEINNSGTTMHSQAHLMLYSGVNSLADSAMGSVTWAQPGGMAAYIGAQTRSTTPNAPSATLTFGTRQAGDGGPSPRMVITEGGNVGIGTILPTAGYRLEVVGATILRPGNGTVQFGSPNAELGMSITPTLGNRADVRFNGTTLKLLAGAGVGPPVAENGIVISTAGNVGIGSPNPTAKLEVVAQNALSLIGVQPYLTLSDASAGYAGSRIQCAGGEMILASASYLNGNDGNAYAKLFNTGNFSVKTLTIRGGADLAEPFELSGADIAKGSVVIIDDENAGKLKLSSRAYDTRVAGIVSGANGVNPGISLHQDGILEDGQNVALSGRVYVLADASTGAIKPGDLLTTSGTPGHAMKVTDHAQSQGAILGKAMSSLKTGKGMVLVLVTLQ